MTKYVTYTCDRCGGPANINDEQTLSAQYTFPVELSISNNKELTRFVGIQDILKYQIRTFLGFKWHTPQIVSHLCKECVASILEKAADMIRKGLIK